MEFRRSSTSILHTNKDGKRQDNHCYYSELKDLLDRHCVRKPLSLFPTKRTIPKRRTTTTNDDDTSSTTIVRDNNIQFDEYLGLRFYHVDPMQGGIRCQLLTKKEKPAFIDFEFCVHEDFFTTTVDDDDDDDDGDEEGQHLHLTPGIITPQNVRDLLSSGIRKREQRAEKFVQLARLGIHQQLGCRRWYWKRGSEMPLGQNRIFASSSSSVRPQNVIQGRIGNCGFCSGFASLAAQFPDVLKSAFSVNDASSSLEGGALSVRLYPNGKKRFLLLDDYVLCISTDHDHTSKSKLFPSPSLHSLDGDDLWVRLLEKAFVKIQSSYASLDGYYKWNSLYRHPARALQLFTGAPIALELHYDHTKQTIQEIFDVLVETEGRCARVAHGRKRKWGLMAGHGYSLLWVGIIAGVKLACLRNPHGKVSYNGEFGRCRGFATAAVAPNTNNSCWCTPNALAVARELTSDENNPSFSYLRGLLTPNYTTAQANQEDENGIFLIGFDVFIKCFPILSVVGPMSSSGQPLLPEFPVTDCLLILHGENISYLRCMLRTASRHEMDN